VSKHHTMKAGERHGRKDLPSHNLINFSTKFKRIIGFLQQLPLLLVIVILVTIE